MQCLLLEASDVEGFLPLIYSLFCPALLIVASMCVLHSRSGMSLLTGVFYHLLSLSNPFTDGRL